MFGRQRLGRSVLAGVTAVGGFAGVLAFSTGVAKAEALLPNDTPRPKTYTVGWDDNWDKRKPERKEKVESSTDSIAKEKAKPRPTRNIYLVRHGQYEMEEKDEDCKLTALGREQAKCAGQRINSFPFKLDRIFYSTMTRATETAKIIMGEMTTVPPNESCDMAREGCPIRPMPDIWDEPTEAEYFEDGARIEAAFRKYIHRPDPDQEETSHEMVVCHGNVIRYFVVRALQVPPEYWLRIGVANASITQITITASGRVSIRALGDVGHVPADKQTFT